MVCLSRTFLVPFFESAFTRTLLFHSLLTGNHVDFVGLTDTSQVKLWIVIKNVLDFMHEVQDCLVGSVKFLSDLRCFVFFHSTNNVEHFRE